ncbi:Sodium:solute symporter family-domain-containing protein [Mrakia frigida]|uniref:sodium:solute symporter family protein n=1 Tax=Mrakia frigida TaxID=29902 RepID=UPI003FCC1DF5
MSSAAILSQGVGYAFVVGMSLCFSAFIVLITFLQKRYSGGAVISSDEFASASRSIKPGLIATGIVSAWTWAATLLQSSAVAYKFGISGPLWYASGATVQILLFAQIAAKLKLNAPYARTFLEIIGCRWKGAFTHCVFLFFGLSTNFIVSTMLVLGGSATVTDLTGMSTIAACFLIPFTVAIYVFFGGMRATLIADYTHTAILFVILLLFMIVVYATSDQIGSPRKMHEMLTAAAAANPVADNKDGSYLTIRSKGALIFGILNIVAYYQRAIASNPGTAVKGFLLGGLAWFSIPFGLATTLGLAAVALGVKLTPAEVGAGLPAPAAAAALLGKGGAVAMLMLLFLAVTSATSAEQVAVSSIFTYDVYKRYINPKATDAQLIRASHAAVLGWSAIMGISGTIFFYIGISMGFLYELMGCLLGSCVVPIALALTWKKANRMGCTVAALAGLVLALTTWIVTAATLFGEVTIDTLFEDYAMLAGNLVALGTGGIVSVTWSLISPEDFDFDITRSLNYVPESTIIDQEAISSTPIDNEAKTPTDEKVNPSLPEQAGAQFEGDVPEIDYTALNKAFKFALFWSLGLFTILIILIPFPLFGSGVVFGVKAFTFWVVLAMVWAFVASLITVIYPLYESRSGLAHIGRGIYLDIFHKGAGKDMVARE